MISPLGLINGQGQPIEVPRGCSDRFTDSKMVHNNPKYQRAAVRSSRTGVHATGERRKGGSRRTRPGTVWLGAVAIGIVFCTAANYSIWKKINTNARFDDSVRRNIMKHFDDPGLIHARPSLLEGLRVVLPTRRLKDSHRTNRNFGEIDLDFDDYEFQPRRILNKTIIEPVFANEEPVCFEPDCEPALLNCQTLHEVGLESQELQSKMKHLGAGAYREGLLVENVVPRKGKEIYVYKRMHARAYEHSDDPLPGIFREAETMEAMTSSPTILDIFGFCHSSVIVESGPGAKTLWGVATSSPIMSTRQIVHKKKGRKGKTAHSTETIRSKRSRLSWEERISFALQAAQGMADLHEANYTHNDMKGDQFLILNGTSVKLNDFNRATRRMWNPLTNDFAVRHYSSKSRTSCNSPESCFGGSHQASAKDIFQFGGVMYVLLTGDGPPRFWAEKDEYTDSDLPLLDVYSTLPKIEQRFIDTMNLCWKRTPEKRISMKDLVRRIEGIAS